MATLSIAGVSERDVDLLLLEEFQSSEPFQRWFVETALGAGNHLGQLREARRSVTHSTGESDLEVSFEGERGVTVLMLENKVNAGLQPAQAQRYLDRGNAYVTGNKCSSFHAVIVAPARYFGDAATHKGFHNRVTYEQLLAWYERAHDIGARRHYKMSLLRSAIDKGTLGYQPEEDAPTTNFWRAYWELASARAPDLEMAEPKAKPSGSTFVAFHPPGLPPGTEIVHKLTFGCVDLQLSGLGNRLNEVRAAFGQALEPDMTVAKAAKSAAIRIAVPKLTMTDSWDRQVEGAGAGIDAARRLFRWFLANEPAWRRGLIP